MTDSLRRHPLAVLLGAVVVLVVLPLVALAAARPATQTGEVFGRMIAVEPASVTIAEMDYLTGDDAARAYEEDTGQIGGPPNPVWLRDRHTTRTYGVAPEISITAIVCDATGSPIPIRVELPELEGAIDHPETASPCTSPYFWLGLEGGEVVRLEAAYIP
jgi:hypothetical protein